MWAQFERDIERKIKSIEKTITNRNTEIERDALAYLDRFPEEREEVDTVDITRGGNGFTVRALWYKRLEVLEATDLPRHKARFKKEMEENISRNLLDINQCYTAELEEYKDTIDGINNTLNKAIYDPTAHSKMRFVRRNAVSDKVQEFRNLLRETLDNAVSETDVDHEDRYQKISKFISKYSDCDRNQPLRRQVLDTRNWNTFIGEEYFLDSNGEEHVRNSVAGTDGGSGGQKMRLAITAIAAGLGYVFGINDPEKAAYSMRAILFDEAFEKFHPASVRASMKLIGGEFGFQTIMATPATQLVSLGDYVRTVFRTYQCTSSRVTTVTPMEIKTFMMEQQEVAKAEMLKNYLSQDPKRTKETFEEIYEKFFETELERLYEEEILDYENRYGISYSDANSAVISPL